MNNPADSSQAKYLPTLHGLRRAGSAEDSPPTHAVHKQEPAHSICRSREWKEVSVDLSVLLVATNK